MGGGDEDSIYEELERFRCLFEYIERLVPPEASKAMQFFKRGKPSPEKNFGSPLELEARLQELVGEMQHKCTSGVEDIRSEVGNMMVIARGLQKDGGRLEIRSEDLARCVQALEERVDKAL